MKQVTLNVPEKRYEFIRELIGQLGLEIAEEVEVPEEHKAIVRDRIKTSKGLEMIPWKQARKQLATKGK